MKQLVTEAIILTRIDYGEADRILTILTPDYGKLHVLAKGVRRVKSKLAGGIELFSVSAITFIPGRNGLDTLASTRLVTHYGAIVGDLDRTMAGYDLIKQLNKATEDQAEPAYFHLLQQTFVALNDCTVPLPMVRLWFACRLLQLDGHEPNLQTDTSGQTLTAGQGYDFSFDHMTFNPSPDGGRWQVQHIKFLRLVFGQASARALSRVQGCEQLTAVLTPLVSTMLQTYLRV